jgi:TPR repeat protein
VTKERQQAALAAYKTGDFKAAMQMYEVLADEGDAFAQFSIGYMYRRGECVTQDDALALTWYRKAAENGYASAQSNLGFMYQFGKGAPQDLDVAAFWYGKASRQGDTTAQLNLMVLVQTVPLLPLMSRLSDGDLSVLTGSLGKPGSEIMTVEGSKNHIVWSAMAKLGWMKELDRDDIPVVAAKPFRITDVGRIALPRALQTLASWPKST